MARHVALGHSVSVLIVAEGISSRHRSTSNAQLQSQLSELRDTAKRANQGLGVSEVTFLGMPDNRLDSVDRLDVIQAVEMFLDTVRADTVYTHHGGDLNIDHRIVFESALTATRPQPGSMVRRLFSFEIPSSSEWQSPVLAPPFQPNWFVDISETLEKKMSALELYHAEMRPWPHARSLQAVRHLAGWRGAGSGCQAAEAFVLVRNLAGAMDQI